MHVDFVMYSSRNLVALDDEKIPYIEYYNHVGIVI